MTLSEALNVKGKLKIVTTDGDCIVGKLQEILWDYEEEQEENEILLNTDEGGYSIYESEIISIEEAE